MPDPNADTPTVSQFLNAANWEYLKSGTPADLRPFVLADGEQLRFEDQEDGISAHAWLTPSDQVVVSYEGTQGVSIAAFATNPEFTFQQIVEDTRIAQGQVTASEVDAANFARVVIGAAGDRGIAATDIFLTGHSLGGIQAQYAAQQTGLGGIAFEATGLPRDDAPAASGNNFVNVVQYGDSVGNYSSDIDAEQGFAPTYSPGGTGALPHYGYVAMIGDPAAQESLRLGAATSSLGIAGLGVTTLAYGLNLAAFHLPGVQAYSLGVDLTQTSPIDQFGVRSGPVLAAADFTIADLIAATHATLSAALPADPAISPTEGAYAGNAAIALEQGHDLIAAAETLLPLLPAGQYAADGGIAGWTYGSGALDAGFNVSIDTFGLAAAFYIPAQDTAFLF